MPKLTRDEGGLSLSLSGASDFPQALNSVKAIPGRRFDGDTKLWRFPNDPVIAERILLTVKPTADPAILTWVRESRAEREQELTTRLPDDADLFVPWRDRLYPFQRAAVDFLAEHPRALLADDMGLGKTIQAYSAVTERCIRYDDLDVSQPRLVIAPNTGKGVWKREARKWLGVAANCQLVDAATLDKREAQIQDAIATGAWCIVNWEQVRVHKQTHEREVHHRNGLVSVQKEVTWEPRQPLFRDTNWLAVIADEAHRAKNRKAAQTMGLWLINAPIKLALTGTPLMNSPDELWAILRWLYPEQYGRSTREVPRTAYWAFHDQYTDSYESYGGSRVVVGVKNPEALRFELQDRLIRRTKAQKLNLPAKTRQTVPLTMNPKQARIYNDAETKFWLEIEHAVMAGDKTAERLASDAIAGKRIYTIPNGAARTVRLRQVLCSPAILGGEDDSAKMDAIVEKIVDNSNQQHVVYTEFIMGANLLVDRLRHKHITAGAFTGDVKDTRVRTEYEDRFQRGEIDVLVGTLGAMRESITLTAANTVHFCERAWVPGWNEQAEDRLHRTGQSNPVTVLIYEIEDSVDTNKVRPTNDLKELIVSSVITKDEVRAV